MRLHNYVDIQREIVVKKTGISSHLKEMPKGLRVLFLKLLEDEILFDKIKRESFIQALTHVYPEEIEMGVTSAIVLKWHQSMMVCCSERPSEFLKRLSEQGLGFLDADCKTILEWCVLLPKYALDAKFVDYVDYLHEALTQKFRYGHMDPHGLWTNKL